MDPGCVQMLCGCRLRCCIKLVSVSVWLHTLHSRCKFVGVTLNRACIATACVPRSNSTVKRYKPAANMNE